MGLVQLVVLCVLSVAWCEGSRYPGALEAQFPAGFKFAVASSSYQIEGAWNASDKAESIWDRFTHAYPDLITDHSNGDVACNSYYKYKEDVQMVANVGVNVYRFSISWPRLLPTGQPDRISRDGLNYYNNLINELIANGIEPMITLYHWDLPQYLQDLGGWANPLVTDWFADYARLVYAQFGDRVKLWVTINEPYMICDVGFSSYQKAPGLNDASGRSSYICTKNVLIAHAKAWRIYDEEFKPYYNGQVAFSNNVYWLIPDTEDDEALVEYASEFLHDRFSHPIYSKEGGWPKKLAQFIEDKSIAEGYPRSRLPELTDEEIELIRGTYDFYGVNHYSSKVVRLIQPDDEIESPVLTTIPELNANLVDVWQGEVGYSEGFRQVLRTIKNKYGENIKIFVTENGKDDVAGLNDDLKVRYLKSYLQKMLLAIQVDKVNVIGYTVWSLMDSFEWANGYTGHLGLYAVDINDPERTRIPRKSARYYSKVIKYNTPYVRVD